MKLRDGKKLCAVFLLIGFFTGILYSNLYAADYIMTSGIFNNLFLKQYQQIEVETDKYVWYLLRKRFLFLGCVGIAGCTRFKKMVIAGVLLWTGFASGMLLTAAVMKLGVKGIVLCLMGLIPHFVCYIASYMIVLWHFLQYPQSRWNGTKMIGCLLLMLSGVLLESYVNPILLKVVVPLIL